MGHWEPGRVFQEMTWVDDDKGCGCGCGCIFTIIAIIAILYGFNYLFEHMGILLIIAGIAIALFVVYAVLKD